jgi:hypothetical protein
MEALWTVIVAGVFVAWFAASVVHQFSPAFWRRAVRSDVYGLLPRWTFFAPNPAREDTHVVYRDLTDGRWSEWQALTPAATSRWLRNPPRYPRKAAIDLANGLRRVTSRYGATPRAILLSNPYIGLLHWVIAQRASRGATHRQFAVVLSTVVAVEDEPDMNVLFVSEVHRVGA